MYKHTSYVHIQLNNNVSNNNTVINIYLTWIFSRVLLILNRKALAKYSWAHFPKYDS